jgi:hypothetical protein
MVFEEELRRGDFLKKAPLSAPLPQKTSSKDFSHTMRMPSGGN